MDEDRNTDSGIYSSSSSPKSEDLTVYPSTSVAETSYTKTEDPLRCLQMALENNTLLNQATPSPKPSENSVEDENKSEGDEFDEQSIRTPKMNSHGKVKTFKCKQCDFVAITKLDYWEHSRCHIKADKRLTCPRCPFVTEYKHHLEYHLLNHFGSKPFKCDKCEYSCVNKSMLNSHMKSHSNIYQYRCADCSYATKYCHSLKLHLRKYSHKPDMVLNPDGTPNPLPIIDVYGTRRGPKNGTKVLAHHQKTEQPQQPPQQSPNLLHPLAQFFMTSFPYSFLGGFPNLLSQLPTLPAHPQQGEQQKPPACSDEVLDLSKPEAAKPNNEISSDEEEEEEEVVGPKKSLNEDDATNNNKPANYFCQFCHIWFGDVAMYTIHMGHHGYNNPFTCNMCGEECKDKISFFLHIARTPHS